MTHSSNIPPLAKDSRIRKFIEEKLRDQETAKIATTVSEVAASFDPDHNAVALFIAPDDESKEVMVIAFDMFEFTQLIQPLVSEIVEHTGAMWEAAHTGKEKTPSA